METTEQEITDFLEKGIYNKFNEVIQTAQPSLLATNKKNVSIFAPDYAIKHLQGYFKRYHSIPFSDGKIVFQGYDVKCGYENKIVLAHFEAPLYPKDNNVKNEVRL